ncbi:hypothetical protein D3C72_1661490 [compost metagenome]
MRAQRFAYHRAGVGQHRFQRGVMGRLAAQTGQVGVAFGDHDHRVGTGDAAGVQQTLHPLRIADFDADLVTGLGGDLA